ncbi:MAG: RNA polymerase subunit sigma-70 [Firmicutes bacterium]|nr:RNA polymerase subunit sigma-70 [Bacillota bacterium]
MNNVDVTEANLWFDFYGQLLTEHQSDIWQLHFQEDWSLAEISALQGVTRAAIQDVLERTANLLRDYERKLGLVAAMRQRQATLSRLVKLLSQLPVGPQVGEAMELARGLALEEGLSDV